MKKLRVFGLSNQDNAVYLYRIIQPLKSAADQGLIDVHHLPFFGQHANHLLTDEFRDYLALEARWADVLFSTIGGDRNYLAILLAMKYEGKMKLVIDIDDDILSAHLDPNNPVSRAYLDPNQRYAEMAQACLREADLITCSTEYLAEKYRSINPNIIVVKNCIDPKLFKYENKPSKKVTLGYAGSGSHQADWVMIEPVLRRLKEKHQVQVAVMGPMYTADVADKQTQWTDMLKYPKTMAELGFTIGLAPLKDSMMTRGKSNLRWLEYSALKIPTVCSPVVPFKGIRNVLTASEPEEWEEQIEKLILSPALRTELGNLAYTEMRETYDQDAYARILSDALHQL